MRFLLLLYDDAAAIAAMRPEERRALVDAHIAFSRGLRERGALVHGDPLDDPSTARTVRRDGERPLVTDGPFLEAKEALGGFYVVECETVDAASELAAEVPHSPGLVVEVRPIPDI